MTPAESLLTRLRRRGIVIHPRGERIHQPADGTALTAAEREDLRAHRDEVLDRVTYWRPGDPDLRTLCRDWISAAGGSANQFVRAFRDATGCDLDRRNPVPEELRVMAALLELGRWPREVRS